MTLKLNQGANCLLSVEALYSKRFVKNRDQSDNSIVDTENIVLFQITIFFPKERN